MDRNFRVKNVFFFEGKGRHELKIVRHRPTRICCSWEEGERGETGDPRQELDASMTLAGAFENGLEKG